MTTVTVKLDRLQFAAQPLEACLPKIRGFHTTQDRFARQKTSLLTYRRFRWLTARKSDTKLLIHYAPACPWLSPVKLSFFPDDHNGIDRYEIRQALSRFADSRLLLVELVFDFEGRVDERFVRRHALFGKSRPRSRWSPGILGYGTRRSSKLVRAYYKGAIQAYRVELQLNARWLRTYGITRVDDLSKVARFVHPKHFRFVRLDREKLAATLKRRGHYDDELIKHVVNHNSSLHSLTTHLRVNLAFRNPHRLLRSMRLDRFIQSSLRRWEATWRAY